MRQALRTKGRTALLTVAAVATLGACSTGTHHATLSKGTGPSPSGAASDSTPPVSADAPVTDSPAIDQVLSAAALTNADVQSAYEVKVQPGGASLKGDPTLDGGCGYHFTSEAHRIARREYGIYDRKTHQQISLTNDIAAYDTHADALEALSQWEIAANTCPDTPQHIDGTKLITTTLHEVANSDALPIPDNALTYQAVTNPTTSQVYYVIFCIQVKGRFLDVIGEIQAKAQSVQDLDAFSLFAIKAGRRLDPAVTT
jgi:hypothetical protein